MVADVSYIKKRAEEKEPVALFLIDQIQNFRKKRPSWPEDSTRRCVVLRHLSARAYEHIRGEMLLKLPCRKTLSNYLGSTGGETGFSKLAEARLRVEAESLTVPQSRVCSLIVDEMKIKEKLQYNKQQDCFVGHADVSLEQQGGDLTLANSLLCFVITGLSTRYRIPVAYYFTKGLTGSQLHKLLIFVLEKVEACGFRVIRLVSDNHKVNVNAMKLLGDGLLTYRIEHPCDSDRLLFLSFDPCHVLKNVRSQFLAHDLGPKGEISSCYIKKLYELQKDLVVKPVRYLSRKHVYPNNIEKMNVARAIQVLSPDVTAALEHLRDQAGHKSSTSFAAAGLTIICMQNMYRWFVLHDTSNTTQHIHKKWPDTRHFDDTEDDWSGLSQDRGGLLYPSEQLLFAVEVLRTFADRALKDNPTLQKPLSTLVKHAVPALCASNLLKCKEGDDIHRVRLMELISVRFLRPLLANYAFNVSDKAFKYFAKKPLSRKYVKL
ncbi:hypothetical protein MTO96_004222 [Rhipicephalus appendiculatus]